MAREKKSHSGVDRWVAAAILGVAFYACNIVDPAPPPLRLFGVDTAWAVPRLDSDTVQLTLPRTVYDSTAFDTLAGPNPGNPLLDSVTFKVRHCTLSVTDLGIREYRITPGFQRRIDSGLAGARYPIPVALETLKTFEVSSFIQQIPEWDTVVVWDDTVVHVEYPNALPMLGLMPLGQTLLVEMGYPAVRAGPLPVLNFRQNTLQVVQGAGEWPGTVEWKGLDSLTLIWPVGDSSRLGKVTGTFTLSDTVSATVGNRPYDVSRVFRRLVPAGSALGAHWSLTAGPIGFVDQGASFFFTTTPVYGDSLAHLRSRFALEGDFVAEVTVRLAPSILNGYMVSMFASADTAPIFFHEPVTGTPGRMSVLSEGAGLCFNVMGTAADLVSFSYDTYAVERNAPLYRNFRLRCERRGNRFTYSVRDAASAAGFQMLRDFPAKAGTAYPARVHLNMALGNFQPQGREIVVEWEDFVILEGLVWP